ncbi:hypothetical protein AMTR_s00014p00194950 [Amborella trichopoda]|uniref:Uncharacterized protein n=1 Tax=Amborella trichopoda TaxID=13333 RepID=W1PGL2_AMBTC|nr:hypothetical protein AMTR_s00014p00194950 [Amborella trichopoda]
MLTRHVFSHDPSVSCDPMATRCLLATCDPSVACETSTAHDSDPLPHHDLSASFAGNSWNLRETYYGSLCYLSLSLARSKTINNLLKIAANLLAINLLLQEFVGKQTARLKTPNIFL